MGGGKCPNCGALEAGKVFCKHCGEVIDSECVVCPKCGKQVKELSQQSATPNITIHNSNDSINTNTNVNTNIQRTSVGGYSRRPRGRCCKKIVALILCLFFGCFGAHKFYEGKTGAGILYLFTAGLFMIGVIIDFIAILGKPAYYYPNDRWY